jgi:Rieske 2Fe-2S family protein
LSVGAAEYLFPRETLENRAVGNAVDFTNTVLLEDAAVCELTQKGLHASRTSMGCSCPRSISGFHQWLARQLERD